MHENMSCKNMIKVYIWFSLGWTALTTVMSINMLWLLSISVSLYHTKFGYYQLSQPQILACFFSLQWLHGFVAWIGAVFALSAGPRPSATKNWAGPASFPFGPASFSSFSCLKTFKDEFRAGKFWNRSAKTVGDVVHLHWSYQGSFCECAHPMRDIFTLLSCLSLFGRIQMMIPE